jgi:hypothetical protein
MNITVISIRELPAKNTINEIVSRMLIRLHWGDIGMARTIRTKWYKGGMQEPEYKDHPVLVKAWKEEAKHLRAALGLSDVFKGGLSLHINGGKVVRAEVSTN